MQQLSLNDNAIQNIGPLNGMLDLQYLDISNNQIDDISPLRRLHAIEVLRLENNQISDVSALAGLINLRELSLAHNGSLYDVRPLLLNSGIGRGDELDLRFTHVRCSDMDAFGSLEVNLLRVTALNGSACQGRRLEDP
jgi:Leucine-rich repeat (LRR) protein